MSYLVVSVDGEFRYSRPSDGYDMEEQLEIYQQFHEEYPNSSIKVEIKKSEPFMGW